MVSSFIVLKHMLIAYRLKTLHCLLWHSIIPVTIYEKNNNVNRRVKVSGGLNNLFQLIIFSIHAHGKWFLKNCISFLWSEDILVIGYNMVSFLHNFMENMSVLSVLTKRNVLFNNEHLKSIWFFWLIDKEFDLNYYF